MVSILIAVGNYNYNSIAEYKLWQNIMYTSLGVINNDGGQWIRNGEYIPIV